jgi:S-adenosyl-L-methionine hydrolase (adenosine-forming)
MRNPLLTLTTDFGLSDHYVGVMKGVILSICPAARLVDICHDLRAYEVSEAAFTLAQAWHWFPRATIHVVVIDPGVGTSRRPILVQAGGHTFVAPDNGVLSMVYSREPKHKVREIVNDRYFLQPVSNTFHGRDIFSPVAAHLASGISPARFGKLIGDYLRLALDQPARTGRRAWTGTILRVDRFGNMVTNFSVEDFAELGRRPFEMAVGLRRIGLLARTYAGSALGEPFVIIGSSGYYEISVNQASAAKLLGCAAGAPVELTLF